ncbi:MAG: tetratricopeptide repeat protein [Sedimenticola sp.]|nr:tetratricopeptide repeat protein [Sedimenticola sp.]
MDIDRSLDMVQRQIQNGQLDGAMDLLRQILSYDPDLPDAHAYLSLCLLSKKRLHASQQEADIALTLDPGFELAHYALANICIALRKFSKAQVHVTQLLDMDPNHASYYLLQAHLYRLLQKKNAILPPLQKALELDPESPEVLSELSEYHADRGDLELAQQFADEALRHEAENVDALVAMGNVLLHQGLIEEAREHAVWALRHQPDSNSALALMAGIKAKSSPVLGIWWRYNVWMSRMGSTRAVLVLLLAFVVYRLMTMGFEDLGHADAAGMLQIAWLGIVFYTFIGPSLFNKSLQKELSGVQLKEDF